MFNRFFNKKGDDSKNARPPHGANSGVAGTETTGGSGNEGGGGFFNLPPVQRSDTPPQNSYSSSGPHMHGSHGNAPQPYGSQHQQPSHPPSGNLFGGMSMKNNVPAMAPAQSSNSEEGSLFSGLDLSKPDHNRHSISSFTPQNESQAIPQHRRRLSNPKSTAKSYNYKVGRENAAPSQKPRPDNANAYSKGMGSLQVKSKQRKKRSTFRPGFGRDLDEETAAALQRGELQEDALKKTVEEKTTKASPPSTNISSGLSFSSSASEAVEPNGGSVLAGLKLHQSISPGNSLAPEQTADSCLAGGSSGGGGILSGLTIHTTSVVESVPKEEGSSLLAGLKVRNNSLKGDYNTSGATEDVTIIKEPETPEEQVEYTLRAFETSAMSFSREIDRISEEEVDLTARRSMLEQQLNGYKGDLKNVEQQQERASEAEDFEQAEALNSTINQIKHSIMLNESDLRKLESDIVSIGKSKDRAFAQQVRETKSTLKELQVFRDTQEKARKDLIHESKIYNENESQRLKFENERIESEMHHIESNLSHLESEKSEIESSIAEQCQPEMRDQKELQEELNILETEFDALRKQMEQKEQEISIVNGKLEEADKAIEIVRKRYSRQLQRLEDREAGIRKTKDEIDSDASLLARQKEYFKKKQEDYKSDLSNYVLKIKKTKAELKMALILSHTLESRDKFRQELEMKKQDTQTSLSKLREIVFKAEQESRAVEIEQEELQGRIVKARAVISSAEIDLPRLEQEKKLAASQRNFKEAGRISKEIKQLTNDKETSEEEIGLVEEEIERLKGSKTECDLNLENKKGDLVEMEKRVEIILLEECWMEARNLRKVLRNLERLDKLRKDSASDLKLSTFLGGARILLETEMKGCQLEIDVYERKYNMEDPRKNEELSEDEEAEGLEDDDIEDDVDKDDYKEDIGKEDNSVINSASTNAEDVVDPVPVIEEGSKKKNLSLKFEHLEGLDSIQLRDRVEELESLIEKATESENYDQAAIYDEELEECKQLKEIIDKGERDVLERMHKLESRIRELSVQISDSESKIEEFSSEERWDAAAELADNVEVWQKELKDLQDELHALESSRIPKDSVQDLESETGSEGNPRFLESSLSREDSTSRILYMDSKDSEIMDSTNKTSDSGIEDQESGLTDATNDVSNMFSGLTLSSSMPPVPLKATGCDENGKPTEDNISNEVDKDGCQENLEIGEIFHQDPTTTTSDLTGTTSIECNEADEGNSETGNVALDASNCSSNVKLPSDDSTEPTEPEGIPQSIDSDLGMFGGLKLNVRNEISNGGNDGDEDTDTPDFDIKLNESIDTEENSTNIEHNNTVDMFSGLSIKPKSTEIEEVNPPTSPGDIFSGLSMNSAEENHNTKEKITVVPKEGDSNGFIPQSDFEIDLNPKIPTALPTPLDSISPDPVKVQLVSSMDVPTTDQTNDGPSNEDSSITLEQQDQNLSVNEN